MFVLSFEMFKRSSFQVDVPRFPGDQGVGRFDWNLFLK